MTCAIVLLSGFCLLDFHKKQLSVHVKVLTNYVYHVRLYFALDKLNNRNDLSYTEYSLVSIWLVLLRTEVYRCLKNVNRILW